MNTDVKALFELSLLDPSGKGKHKVHSHFDRPLESRPYTLQKRGSMWGYKRFTMLEQSDYLKDDCLKFHCIVGLLGDDLVGKRDEKDKEETLSHQNQLAEMIRSYL